LRKNRTFVPARPGPGGFTVDTETETLHARAVVMASGFQWYPRIPEGAAALPAGVLSLHSSDYRRPGQLPDGAVVVVGAAQSGAQIALELASSGRPVYMCTSRARRLPRRYRGRDAFVWWSAMGLLDQPPEALADAATMRLPQPVLSGAEGGRSISLHQLGRAGVTLLGRLVGVDGATLTLADDRDDNIAYADRAAVGFRREIDEYIMARGEEAPEAEPDPADERYPLPPAPQTLDLAGHGVGTVLWCTGHLPSTPWLTVPDTHPGIHVLGRPWLTHRSSGILYGIPADAARVAHAIAGTRPAGGAATA
jgi:putative flavoprotein involved in K+ transport